MVGKDPVALCGSMCFKAHKYMSTVIPSTIRQAFKVLDGMLSAEEIRSILAKGKNRFVSDEHFGLGLWIRNNWIYADKESKGLFAYDSDHPGIIDTDYQSGEFLGKYYNHLKRKQRAK